MLGVREALGGPWATNFASWFICFGPAVLLVLLQEASTSYFHPGFAVLSGIAQHLVAGLLALLFSVSLRRWRPVLPIWVSLMIWGVVGVARGIVGGVFAAIFSTDGPDFAFRVASWLAIAWVWGPLLVYLLAQLDNRRKLMRGLAVAVDRRDEAVVRAARSTDDIREQLVSAIVTTVGPVVDDIRGSLRAARGKITESQMRAISDRLGGVSAETARMVERLSPPPPQAPQTVPERTLPFAAVLDFERQRPLRSSIFTGVALIALFAPISMRLGQLPLSLAAVLALCGTALALGISRLLVKGHQPGATPQAELRRAAVRHAFAAATGCAILAAFAVNNSNIFAVILTALLPFSLLFASATVWAAVGIAGVNRSAFDEFCVIEEETRRLDATAATEENSIREQLSGLMHGPVQGRLAACAMALNFHAAEAGTVASAKTRSVTTAVLENLDAASGDLNALQAINVNLR